MADRREFVDHYPLQAVDLMHNRVLSTHGLPGFDRPGKLPPLIGGTKKFAIYGEPRPY